MSIPELILASFVGVFLAVIWFGQAYLMLAKPERWVEWFLTRPWGPLGVSVTIDDPVRLRRMTRRYGMVFAVVGGTVLACFIFMELAGS